MNEPNPKGSLPYDRCAEQGCKRTVERAEHQAGGEKGVRTSAIMGI